MTSELPPPADAGAGGGGSYSGGDRRSGDEHSTDAEHGAADEHQGEDNRRVRRDRTRAGDAPPRWTPEAPRTETLELLRTRLPLSIRLIGRSSWPSAVLVLAIAAVFVGAVPLAAKLQLNAMESAGEVIPVGNVIELTVADDWSLDSQSVRATVLSGGSSQLVILPAYEESRTATAIATAEISVAEGDGAGSWVRGEPTSFRTDADDPVTTVGASSETNATQVWAVTHDGLATIAVLSTTVESWGGAQQRVHEMVDSIEFSTGPTDGQSGAGDPP